MKLCGNVYDIYSYIASSIYRLNDKYALLWVNMTENWKWPTTSGEYLRYRTPTNL